LNARKAEAALVWNTLVWGSTFVVVKTALNDISPILFLAFRFSLAAIALTAIFGWKLRRVWDWRAAAAGTMAGAFLFLGYLTQTLGLRLTTAPRSAFLTGLTSVLVPLLAACFYRNRPQISEVVGLAVATLGMGLMTLHGYLGSTNPGDLLTILCAVAYAAHIVVLGHFSERMNYQVLSVTQIGAGAVFSIALFWWAETPFVRWRPAVAGAILITGLLATALAFTIQAWAQQYTTSTRTGLIFTLEPVFAWVTSFLIAGETLSGRAASGALLILGGVVLVEMKPWNPRPHPSN
jgi:drug/metabolite transporter (DMT)-like permease